MQTQLIVRAIDVGYGDTKFVRAASGGRIDCEAFPSLAFTAQGSRPVDSLGSRRRTVMVKVGEIRYEVGPDVLYAADRFVARNFHDRYIETDEYAALTAGAIAMMRVPHIDVLALGLPVETYMAKRKLLEKLMTRSWDVGRKEPVEVRRVVVFAQPHGAMFSVASAMEGGRALLDSMSLVIDVGSRTFDYLAVQAMKVFDSMSGSVNRGVSDVVRAIAEDISQDLAEPVRHFAPIEEALRKRGAIEILGHTYPFARFQPLVNKVAKQAVQQMLGSFPGVELFKNVIVVGGGANLFRKAIETYFPAHNVIVARDPVFANVRGFQMIAERGFQSQSRSTDVASATGHAQEQAEAAGEPASGVETPPVI
jgi:plasmid segregation protein ParM